MAASYGHIPRTEQNSLNSSGSGWDERTNEMPDSTAASSRLSKKVQVPASEPPFFRVAHSLESSSEVPDASSRSFCIMGQVAGPQIREKFRKAA